MIARTLFTLACLVALLSAMRVESADKPKAQEKQPGVIKGTISDNNLGVNQRAPVICRITVESGKDKGKLAITAQTKILKEERDKHVMALPKDLTPGSSVRVKYQQPVAESKPWQATALEVLILKQAK